MRYLLLILACLLPSLLADAGKIGGREPASRL